MFVSVRHSRSSFYTPESRAPIEIDIDDRIAASSIDPERDPIVA
jgi:hypothetical protein